jgi:hypothetical protein
VETKVAKRGHFRKDVQNSQVGKVLDDPELEYRVESSRFVNLNGPSDPRHIHLTLNNPNNNMVHNVFH